MQGHWETVGWHGFVCISDETYLIALLFDLLYMSEFQEENAVGTE